MIRFITAYECPECGLMHTRKDAIAAGPLVACAKCGELYIRGLPWGACDQCEEQEERIVARMACGRGCTSRLLTIRVLQITGCRPYDRTMPETSDGGFLVQFATADLKRMAAEATKQAERER